LKKPAISSHDLASSPSREWQSALEPTALGLAVGICYFLAAHLSLLLLTQTDGVAVFWPAAGIASGVLIAFGPKARMPVTAGVMTATVVANLLGDRNVASAILFAVANASEGLFAAWLISRRFGSDFNLDSVHRVLNLFAATAIAAGLSGVVATAAVLLFYNQSAPILTTWFNWFASDGLGAAAVAPLIFGIVRAARNPRDESEAFEGTLAVIALAVVSAITFGASSSYWFTIAPLGLILPLLLWLAARSQPVFAAAGVFVIALVIVWAITFGIGRLGDPSIPDFDRVLAARSTLLVVSLSGFILAALFAERRHNEAILAENIEQLRLAMDGAELGVWRLDIATGQFESDTRDRKIHGHSVKAPPKTLAEARSHIHPDDLTSIDEAFRESGRSRSNFKVEYRLAPAAGSMSERWVALEATIRRDGKGRPVQLLGVTHDITERKQHEGILQGNERKLRELLEALPAAIYVTDAAGCVTYCNEAAVELWGTSPKLGEDKWCDLARFYHRDGVPMLVEDCPTGIALKQGRSMRSLEAILERRDGTRVPIMPCPTPLYDAAGAIIGAINMTVDISERKISELALAERNMQLDLAGKVALVGTFAFDVTSGRMNISPGYAAIHGLSEESEECSRADWRARVHPDDLPRLESRFEQTLSHRRHDHYCDYRIIHPDGDVRWIESRSFVFYDGTGPRLVGANIDVTDRKRVERTLWERNTQLSLAEKAAGVGGYTYEVGAELMQITEGYAALHGLANGIAEAPRNEWELRVHPADRVRVDRVRAEAFRECRAEYGLEYRIVRAAGEVRWIESRSFISYDDRNRPQRVIGLNIDVTDRRHAEDHQRLLIAELDHRVKNVLATVAAVAASTLENSRSTQHFVAALDARIRALASTHELLSTRRWQGLQLGELIKLQLSPYAARDNARTNGPDVLLAAEAGQAVAMVLHELVTNAAKYGALSTNNGRVSVQWHWRLNGAERDRLIIDWQEAEGPIVRASGKSGYGTGVINDLVPYELGGKVDFKLSHTGVCCRLEIPAKWTMGTRQPEYYLNGSAEKGREKRLINEIPVQYNAADSIVPKARSEMDHAAQSSP
jgi:PAS domain S-box-containing protein